MTVEELIKEFQCDKAMAEFLDAVNARADVKGLRKGRIEGIVFVDFVRPIPYHRKNKGVWLNTKSRTLKLEVSGYNDATAATVDGICRAAIERGARFSSAHDYKMGFKYIGVGSNMEMVFG